MSKKSVFLDVDTKILERNLLITDHASENEDFEKFLRSPENFSNSETPWKLVTPEPGFCVKTVGSNGKKAFINICQIQDIPEPKEVSDQELLELWESEDPTDYRVPLSIQEPHEELDKSGKPVMAYDIAVNKEFFKKMQERGLLRTFFLQVAFEGIENKFDITLKKEGFIILQNRRSLGILRPHRIRCQKGPYVPPRRMIEEIPDGGASTAGSGDTKVLPKNYSEPKYRLFKTSKKVLQGEFQLPKVTSTKDINLEIGEDRIVLECSRSGYLLDIFVPLSVNPSDTTAQFNVESKILTVLMPIMSSTG